MKKAKVSRLKPSDWPAFQNCFLQVLRESFSHYPARARKWFAGGLGLQQSYEKGSKFFWVAKEEENLVGFLVAKLKGKMSYINWLGVRQSHQKKGIGLMLVKAWEAWATKKGLTKLKAVTTKETNQQFWAKAGFRLEKKVIKGRLGLDHWHFQKRIMNK